MLEEEGGGGRRYAIQSMSSGRCSVILCIHEVIVSISWGPNGRRRLARYMGDATESEEPIVRMSMVGW